MNKRLELTKGSPAPRDFRLATRMILSDEDLKIVEKDSDTLGWEQLKRIIRAIKPSRLTNSGIYSAVEICKKCVEKLPVLNSRIEEKEDQILELKKSLSDLKKAKATIENHHQTIIGSSIMGRI